MVDWMVEMRAASTDLLGYYLAVKLDLLAKLMVA